MTADEAGRVIFPVEPAQDTVWTIEHGVIRTYTRREHRRWTREDWGQSGGGWVTWEGIGGRADDRTIYLVKPEPRLPHVVIPD